MRKKITIVTLSITMKNGKVAEKIIRVLGMIELAGKLALRASWGMLF